MVRRKNTGPIVRAGGSGRGGSARPSSPESRRATPSQRRFRDLAKVYYDETFERFPVVGAWAGLREYDGELGRCMPETWERQIRLGERTLAAIEDLPPQDFGASDWLDRRALTSNLRLEGLRLKTLRRWENDPQIHLNTAVEAIFNPFVRHADDLGPVAGSMIARLKKIPKFLDEAAGCLKRPEPLWQGLTVRMTPGLGRFYESLAEPLAQAAGRAVEPVRRAARAAAGAVADYARRVERLRPAPDGGFAIGEERMRLMIHERLGLCYSPRESATMGRQLAETIERELTAEARRFHPRKSPHEVLEEARTQWRPEGGSLIEAYRGTVRHIREKFEQADWISFPKGDRLLVRPVPDFLRDQFPTAAYSSPGPFDDDQTGIFWVNDLSAAAKDPRRGAEEVAQHFGVELTCAHEAYPGHHLQYMHQNRHPSISRRMAHHSIYYEGWTLWCEQMTADLGDVDNPYLRLSQLHDELWRAWRIVVDVGLQTGAMTVEQACRCLMREVGFTRARAQADVNWYTAAPTVPMSYLLGKHELLRLKRQRVDLGGLTLKEFNDWVLSFGAIPWRWIEESGL